MQLYVRKELFQLLFKKSMWLKAGFIIVALKYYRATNENEILQIFPEVLEIIDESSKLKYEKKLKDKECTIL